MKNINWEVLVGAVGIILLVVLGWISLKSDLYELHNELRGMHSELSGMHGDLRDMRSDMRSEFRGMPEDIGIIKFELADPEAKTAAPAGDASAD